MMISPEPRLLRYCRRPPAGDGPGHGVRRPRGQRDAPLRRGQQPRPHLHLDQGRIQTGQIHATHVFICFSSFSSVFCLVSSCCLDVLKCGSVITISLQQVLNAEGVITGRKLETPLIGSLVSKTDTIPNIRNIRNCNYIICIESCIFN